MRRKMSTFEFDEKTTALLEKLKISLGVTTKSEVIRKSLKIAGTLSIAQDEGAIIYIQEKGQENLSRVILT
jgi:hypothetical protein